MYFKLNSIIKTVTLISVLVLVQTSTALATPPMIDYNNVFEMPTCLMKDLRVDLEAVDWDGDSIWVYSTLGFPVLDTIYIDTSGASHWLGAIEFDIDQYCGEVFEDELIIIADDGAEADTLNYGLITFEGMLNVRFGSIEINLGDSASLPVYLDIDPRVCLGGFSLTLTNDSSHVEVLDVTLGDQIDGGSVQLGWNINPEINDALRIVVYELTPNDSILCGIRTDLPILDIHYYLKPGGYPDSNPITISLITDEATNNLFTDNTGMVLWAYDGCENEALDLQYEPGIINVPDSYRYLPGDANMLAGGWPPAVIGSDITYLVNYFRGTASPCILNGLYASGDINGDCSVLGSDVTYLVGYFRGAGQLRFCEDYTPSWPVPEDLPSEMPSGWPDCE